jgi:hypothetical protein
MKNINELIDKYLTEEKKKKKEMPAIIWKKDDKKGMLSKLKRMKAQGFKSVKIHSDSRDPYGYTASIASTIKELEGRIKKSTMGVGIIKKKS